MQEFIKNLRVDGPYLLPINDSPKGTCSYKDNLEVSLNFLASHGNTKFSMPSSIGPQVITASVDKKLDIFITC